MKRRRFIAGAVCPGCGEMDRLVLEAAGQRRLCVSCGYTDSVESAASSEPKTRLAGGLEKTKDRPEDILPVRILDPGAPSDNASSPDTPRRKAAAAETRSRDSNIDERQGR